MNFNEVLLDLRRNAGGSYTALSYDDKESFLSVYVVSNDKEDPEWITAHYEGGMLFSSCGEEDSFSLDEMPKEVSLLEFRLTKGCPETSGYVAEHVAFLFFPQLTDPELIYSLKDQQKFASDLALLLKR